MSDDKRATAPERGGADRRFTKSSSGAAGENPYADAKAACPPPVAGPTAKADRKRHGRRAALRRIATREPLINPIMRRKIPCPAQPFCVSSPVSAFLRASPAGRLVPREVDFAEKPSEIRGFWGKSEVEKKLENGVDRGCADD
jgi:hypothetical protein